MAMSEAQKRYQNSPKGKAARARHMAKRKAQKEAAKQNTAEATPAE